MGAPVKKKKAAASSKANGRDIQIVVLQRGWVVVGNFSQNKTECKVTDGFVVRRWGTEKGLGQLANEGPKENTTLDPIPETKFHELTVVARMKCAPVWEATCKQP